MDRSETAGEPLRLLDDAAIGRLLREARTIAVVGASSTPARPSHGVFRTLLDAGYECVPVNPNETEVQGVPAVATLAEAAAALGGHIDIVDVFRRSELTEEVAREAVAVGAAPYDNPSIAGSAFKSFAATSTLGLALRSTSRATRTLPPSAASTPPRRWVGSRRFGKPSPTRGGSPPRPARWRLQQARAGETGRKS